MKPKAKIEREFTYHGLGFPVILRGVPMKCVRGTRTPRINLNGLMDHVLESLAEKPGPLTGDEVRFIRRQLGLTLAELAEQLGVTHAAVSKWEATAEGLTGMAFATEVVLRMRLLARQPKTRKAQFVKVLDVMPAAGRNKKRSSVPTPVIVDAATLVDAQAS